MSTSTRRILIVDDQESIVHFLRQTLEGEGYEVRGAGTVALALAALDEFVPDAILLDLKLPDGSGLDLLPRLRVRCPNACIVMMTAFGDVGSSVQAMKDGAQDYVNKPIKLEELLQILDRNIGQQRRRPTPAPREVDRDLFAGSEDVVPSRSARMAEIYELVRRISVSGSSTVLIQGESGVGKDVLANLIHRNSPRARQAFLEINCASLPEQLLESELFGHEKGAFTDAVSEKVGLLELAHRGTLFLDEIGEMSPSIQVKLLRVLEKMAFRRVGGIKDIQVDVRILCATNRDLRREVDRGGFREDLFYRLNVIPLEVPPLRDRTEDVLPLCEHFLARYSKAFGKGFTGIAEDAARALKSYGWPGNIRELRNLMERVALLEDGELLAERQIPFQGRELSEADIIERIGHAITEAIPQDGLDFEDIVSELERSLIEKAFRAADGNQSQTAKLLRMNRDKLRYRMKNFELI